MVRTEQIDRDGDGSTDLTIQHRIVENNDGSRSETTTYRNSDNSLRSEMTETVSADGQTRTISTDEDGDGIFEDVVTSDIQVNSDGSSVSTITTLNDDGSVRGAITQTQSEDALTKGIAQDLDGDGHADITTHEQTTINADGSRIQRVTRLPTKLQIIKVRQGDAARNGNHQDNQERAYSKPTTRCARLGYLRSPTIWFGRVKSTY